MGCEGGNALHTGADSVIASHNDYNLAWEAVGALRASRAAKRSRFSSFMATDFGFTGGMHFHAPIDNAFASSTYSNSTTGAGPANIYGAARALAPGSGYWCSTGHHEEDQIIAWKGFLKKRRPISGMKISWAYAPGEFRVMTSSDTIHWDTVTDWHKPLRDQVSYEEDLVFDRARNIMELKVEMRHPKDWGYFGINQATLVM